ncbi:MAG: hypothetical protein IJ461_09630, partial [Clostridia bacterium]|nr:hypothetical protein [Clostridia bacterium]
MRKSIVALGVWLLFWIMPLTVQAAELTDFYVQSPGGEGKSATAVQWFRQNSKTYDLFLPAGMKTENVQVC